MKAKDMFEQLGYKIFENNYWIYLTKETTYYTDRISFIKNTKEIEIERFTGNKTLTKKISVSELKAINQQIKELGWDNE